MNNLILLRIKTVLRFVVSISLPLLVGFFGALFTAPAISGWYVNLQKPAFNPPDWVFGPIWTLLYILMGISFYLIWISYTQALDRQEKRKIKLSFGFFFLQLLLNAFWSVIFFGLQAPGWALVEITFLWFTIMLTVIIFLKISKWASWLLVPYLLWVSFAVYLNYSIWILN